MKFLRGRELSCFDEENHHPGGVEASGVVFCIPRMPIRGTGQGATRPCTPCLLFLEKSRQKPRHAPFGQIPIRPKPAFGSFGLRRCGALRAVLTPRFATLTLILIALFSGGGHDPAGQRNVLAVFLFDGQRSACPLIRRKKEHRDLTSSATVAGAGSLLAASVFALARGRVAYRWLFCLAKLRQHPCLEQHRSTLTCHASLSQGSLFRSSAPQTHSQRNPPHIPKANTHQTGARNAAGGRPPPDRKAGGRAGDPPARTGPLAATSVVQHQGRTPRPPSGGQGGRPHATIDMIYVVIVQFRVV